MIEASWEHDSKTIYNKFTGKDLELVQVITRQAQKGCL